MCGWGNWCSSRSDRHIEITAALFVDSCPSTSITICLSYKPNILYIRRLQTFCYYLTLKHHREKNKQNNSAALIIRRIINQARHNECLWIFIYFEQFGIHRCIFVFPCFKKQLWLSQKMTCWRDFEEVDRNQSYLSHQPRSDYEIAYVNKSIYCWVQ